ncbi:hypothetical protein BpHYR1_019196 [Brachionus plicatilis]|uniref:Uncharacterized protein n=1 Tax=Brachionus plicatilis TaxID=10195 RepID=A0A3M7S6C5_BRAPC|nr:hypothetical protein BpHYR1_019196 [Brachionus plicatilis]
MYFLIKNYLQFEKAQKKINQTCASHLLYAGHLRHLIVTGYKKIEKRDVICDSEQHEFFAVSGSYCGCLRIGNKTKC